MTHHSPCCKSPTELPCFMVWRMQSIVPTPDVERSVNLDVFASVTAWCFTQVEHCLGSTQVVYWWWNKRKNSPFLFDHWSNPSELCILCSRKNMPTPGSRLGPHSHLIPFCIPFSCFHRRLGTARIRIFAFRSTRGTLENKGWTYWIDLGALHQLGGRLRPGCGQAGQTTAHSPSCVAWILAGSCPHPLCLSILRLRHWQTMHKRSLYQS